MAIQSSNRIEVDTPEAALKALKRLIEQGFTEILARRAGSEELVEIRWEDANISTKNSQRVQKMM